MHELDISLAGRWAQLQWTTVANSAAARVADPTKIDQAALGVCGVAAALEAGAEANALEYARLVAHVFATGQVGDGAVNAKLLQAGPHPGVDVRLDAHVGRSGHQQRGTRDYPGHPTDYDPSGRKINVPVYRQGGHDPEGTWGGDEEKLQVRQDQEGRLSRANRVWAATPGGQRLPDELPNDVVVLVHNDSGLLDAATPGGPV